MMVKATVTSPTDLCTPVLKPRVWHFGPQTLDPLLGTHAVHVTNRKCICQLNSILPSLTTGPKDTLSLHFAYNPPSFQNSIIL